MTTWETYLHANQARYLDELCALLRIPSISALPEHAADVARAADWVAARLAAAGLEHAQVLPTGGHPVVYADWLHAPGKMTALVYGHFDVQPVDPLGEWRHPPFEPHIENDRLYARGATDNKGNAFLPIAAVEALLRTAGRLPINVKFVIEGQEEIGSPQLAAWVPAHRELLACDLILNADLGGWSETQPAIMTGLRGICGLQVNVVGPSHDLHSGTYGGMVHNPLHALVRLLDSMRAPDGRVLVEGFYDDVAPISAAERAAIAAVPFDEAAARAELGVEAFHGEPGYTPLERTWIRPTLELSGLWGGFQGVGNKTVIPSTAHVKITCRLVANQDPARILDGLRAHVARHCPPGVRCETVDTGGGASPYALPFEHPDQDEVKAVLRAL
ncbi:MAG: dipeptidase, partial [Chloroflexota bacterium]